MLAANELRIGNWVTELRNSRIVSIDGIEPNQEFVWVNYLNGFGQYKVGINNIEPIPLTPEILEKCGLISNSYFQAFNGKDLDSRMFIINNDTNSFYLTFLDDMDFIIVRLYHLHQLQNLYFALTGEELTYTP